MVATKTFLHANSNGADLGQYTFAGEDFGAADPARFMIAVAATRGSTARTMTGITIGGVTANLTTVANNTGNCGIGCAFVPTGTTGNVVVDMSGSVLRCGIKLYRAVGLLSATPHHALTSIVNNPTANLNCPANGIIIACAMDTSLGTHNWTGLTKDEESSVEGIFMFSCASGEFATQQTGLAITADPSTNNGTAGVFCSWGPDANVVATPTAASLILSTFAPTIALSGPQVVTPDTASLILSTFAPIVTATSGGGGGYNPFKCPLIRGGRQ